MAGIRERARPRAGDEVIRCALTFANRQPAVANYLKRPGSDVFVPMALDVLTISGGEIAEIVTFPERTFAAFGLAATL